MRALLKFCNCIYRWGLGAKKLKKAKVLSDSKRLSGERAVCLTLRMRPIFTTSRWGQQLHCRFVRRAHPPAILNRFASNAEGLTTSNYCRFTAARRSARGGQTTLNVWQRVVRPSPHSHSINFKREGARGVVAVIPDPRAARSLCFSPSASLPVLLSYRFASAATTAPQ